MHAMKQKTAYSKGPFKPFIQPYRPKIFFLKDNCSKVMTYNTVFSANKCLIIVYMVHMTFLLLGQVGSATFIQCLQHFALMQIVQISLCPM